MSALTASFISIIIAGGALVMAIISIVIVTGAGGGFTNNTVTVITGVPVVFLALRDTRVQSLNGPDIWTHIGFNTRTLITDAWSHQDTIVQADRTGFYIVYLSVQAQVSNTVTPNAACRPCNLRYAIRATQQRNGTGGLFEVPGSLTYSNGQNSFLSKQFHVNATQGDVFRFQFQSKCETLQLQPFPFVQDVVPVPVGDTFPVSATLLIS